MEKCDATFVSGSRPERASPKSRIRGSQAEISFTSGHLAWPYAMWLYGLRPGDVYNLASGVETSIFELATLINQLNSNPDIISSLLARPGWIVRGSDFVVVQSKRNRKWVLNRAILLHRITVLSTMVEWTRKRIC